LDKGTPIGQNFYIKVRAFLSFDPEESLVLVLTDEMNEKDHWLNREKIRSFDVGTGKEIATLTSTGSKQTSRPCFVSNGKAILVQTWDLKYPGSWEPDPKGHREYRLFDRSGKPVGQPLKLPAQKGAVWHSLQSRYLLVQGEDEQNAQLWETQTGKAHRKPLETGKIQKAAFSPDGKIVVINSDKGLYYDDDEEKKELSMRAWDVSSGKVLRSMDDEQEPVFAHVGEVKELVFLRGKKTLLMDTDRGVISGIFRDRSAPTQLPQIYE
jgi:dipeptidyl aminopeptidase/acylaminoacyl peptidase